MLSDEQKMKEELLGVMKRPQVTGDNVVDFKEIRKRLKEDDEAAAVSFCKGCGRYSNLNAKGAKDFVLLIGLADANIKGKYFETKTCILCQGIFTGVFMKEL